MQDANFYGNPLDEIHKNRKKQCFPAVEICVKLQMTKTSEMCYNEEDTMWGLGVLPIGKTQQQCCF